YHYFTGKDEIILDINTRQKEIIERWSARTPKQVQSLEGHINRLFLDLSSNIEPYRKLVRSVFTLTTQHDRIRQLHLEHISYMYRCLLKWLPEPRKVELLLSVYQG